MTKYYCDICDKQIPAPNLIEVLVAPNNVIEFDLCSDCKKAIKKAKEDAEIKTVNELRICK